MGISSQIPALEKLSLLIAKILLKPEKALKENAEEVYGRSVLIAKDLFESLLNKRIHVEGFDIEQIWEQIEDELDSFLESSRMNTMLSTDLIQETISEAPKESENDMSNDLEDEEGDLDGMDLEGDEDGDDLLGGDFDEMDLGDEDSEEEEEGNSGDEMLKGLLAKGGFESESSDDEVAEGEEEEEKEEDLQLSDEEESDYDEDMKLSKKHRSGMEHDFDEDDMEDEDDEEDDPRLKKKKKMALPIEEDKEEEEEVKEEKKDTKQGGKGSFKDMLQIDDRLNDELDEIEQQLIGDKHWSMGGEIKSKARPVNSLLEQHLELPRFKKADTATDAMLPDTLDVNNEDATDFNSKLTTAIEMIILKRIQDLNFDDVVRKEPPRKITVNEEEGEVLSFAKSKEGLAEIYEEQYRTELLGEKSSNDKALDKAKEDITKLFAKLMHKLDALANYRHQGNFAKHNVADKNISSIQVEEIIPVTMSTAMHKAPEQLHAVTKELQAEEMTGAQKKALRGANKRRRENKTRGMLKEGTMSLQDSQKRKNALEEKNKQATLDRKSKKATGLSVNDAKRENYKLAKKVNSTDLLSSISRK